jgi:hypothetical protein
MLADVLKALLAIAVVMGIAVSVGTAAANVVTTIMETHLSHIGR